MIHNLLTAISALLQAELGGQPPGSDLLFAAASAEPTATDRPTITIYPGNWVISQIARDANQTTTRPQEMHQIIPLSSSSVAPYSLNSRPIRDTMTVQLVFGDRKQSLKNTDFSIDYNKLTLDLREGLDVTGATQLSVSYSSYNLLFSIREFQQDFWVDIYDRDFAELERWSSLVSGILLTSHDLLIEQYNTPEQSQPKTEYQTQQFNTNHTLSQFRLLEGTYLSHKQGIGLQLKFTAVGQIKMTKQLQDGDTLIQEILIEDKI